MRISLMLIAVLLTSQAHAELAGPWAIGSKACARAMNRMSAAETKNITEKVSEEEMERLLSDTDCACDIRTSDIKSFFSCTKEQRRRLLKR